MNMAGTIVDFFGYLSTDKTDAAKLASARRQCPFLGKQCTKPVAEDDAGGISGACAVAQIKDATPTICCPIRLYADDYKMLKIIAYKSFGVDLNLYSGKNKLALYKAKEEGGKPAANTDKLKALRAAMDKIEKNYGKGSIMKLGDENIEDIEVIPTGSIALNAALGVGGYPKGRIVEIYGPESSGKTTIAIHAIDRGSEKRRYRRIYRCGACF